MKNILFSFAVLGSLALASCNKFKEVLFPSFETTIGEVALTVPAVSNTTSEVGMGNIIVGFNIDSVIRKFTANQFSIDHVKSVKVASATLNFLNGDAGNNFSNFENVKLSISSDTNPTPVVIASTIITGSESPLVMNGNDVDIKEYLKSGSLRYTISGKAKKATTKPLEMSVEVQLKVN